MQYLAKWRPHPDVMWCWLIYRPVRSCTLSLRHKFLAPVLFSSVTLPLGGSWCCLVALFQLWLGVPGALVSWDWWVSGHTWLGVQGHYVGWQLQSPREVLLLQVCSQKTFTSFSHNFLLWTLSHPFCTKCPTSQERRYWKDLEAMFLFLTCQNWGLQLLVPRAIQ